MKGSRPLRESAFSKRPDGKYEPGEKHPRWVSPELLLERLAACELGSREIVGLVQRERSRRYAIVFCPICTRTYEILSDNILTGKSSNCRCQRGVKYNGDPRAETLGQRYDAMVQRCERSTHVSSKNYLGRGIKVLFRSREHFIRWALAKWPKTDFKGLDFDRKDNDGHYSPGNLRLVTRGTNLRNRRPKASRSNQGAFPANG